MRIASLHFTPSAFVALVLFRPMKKDDQARLLAWMEETNKTLTSALIELALTVERVQYLETQLLPIGPRVPPRYFVCPHCGVLRAKTGMLGAKCQNCGSTFSRPENITPAVDNKEE